MGSCYTFLGPQHNTQEITQEKVTANTSDDNWVCLRLLQDRDIPDLMNPPIIAHIKNTALKENPKENKPDFSGTMERDMLVK